MEKKKCNVCGYMKEIKEFRLKKKGQCSYLNSQCKTCESKYKKEYNKQYRETHKDYYSEYHKKYDKLYREENKEEIKNKKQIYRIKNRKKLNKYDRDRRENDPIYKIKEQVRWCVRDSFKRKSIIKLGKTFDMVGLNGNDLYEYLSQTYKNNYGVEWDGKEKIHIDHIMPLSVARNERDVIKLCYYTNLQLLKECDNIKKSNKLDWTISKS